MSSFPLNAPPTVFTVLREAFKNQDHPNKIQFQGTCARGTMFVIWDKSVVTLSDGEKAQLKALKKGDKVVVEGDWSVWINKKNASYKISFLLNSFGVKEDGLEDDDDEFPVAKDFNYEESDDALMLKYYQMQIEMDKLERKAGERSNDVRKIVKRGRLLEEDDDEQENIGDAADREPRSALPAGSSTGGGSGGSSAGGGSGGSSTGSGSSAGSSRQGGNRAGAGSASQRPTGLGANRRNGGLNGVTPAGTHTNFDAGTSNNTSTGNNSMLVD
ncbi:hypothetical protein BG015_001843 [Linnemannia schmuckeri]|uniref:Nucleic acid-binding protein n=1 Tax=Linnemannia schmuckeri TaxID=64567 RepID=A0A9P5RP92_9FUNG|nr:hypothetical protein BG015_001843 [Linnemannia schmuckeri]